MGDLLTLNLSNRNWGDEVRHNGELIPVIKQEHIPLDIAAPFLCGSCHEKGFSFYRGIMVLWYEYCITRVLTFIDEMEPDDRAELVLVQYGKGSISFLWRSYIPDKYTEESNEIEVHEDSWNISKSCIQSPSRPFRPAWRR